jgi:hypothetical protein
VVTLDVQGQQVRLKDWQGEDVTACVPGCGEEVVRIELLDPETKVPVRAYGRNEWRRGLCAIPADAMLGSFHAFQHQYLIHSVRNSTSTLQKHVVNPFSTLTGACLTSDLWIQTKDVHVLY